MHAGFPQFSPQLSSVLRVGLEDSAVKALLVRGGGHVVADALALLLRLGFGFVMRQSLLDPTQSQKAMRFFEDNFEIDDPQAPGGKRYYQGRFLIRTSREGDDMNVLVAFCPEPQALFCERPWGRTLDPAAVVRTQVLDEAAAAAREREVDLVIRFRDVEAILGLAGRAGGVDVVGLLLENLVQLTGNVGHLFKLGAIGADVQLALEGHL